MSKPHKNDTVGKSGRYMVSNGAIFSLLVLTVLFNHFSSHTCVTVWMKVILKVKQFYKKKATLKINWHFLERNK